MKIKLHQIATIHTGVFARTTTKGDAVYLKAKHFDDDGNLIAKLHTDLSLNNTIQKHLLKPGDVLFAAKGTKNFAALYESNNKPAVASTSFFIIRLENNSQNKILPEYLVWFLNHPSTQKLLKRKAIGTNIVSISKTVLEELEIQVTDAQTQAIILNINQLWNKEKKLTRQIEALKETVIQQQILSRIN